MNNTIDDTKEVTESREFGKFGTAEELLRAYNALESEFTKRCQLLKQLQAELNALRTQVDGEHSANDSDGDNGAPAAEPCDDGPQMSVAVAAPKDGELEIPAEIYNNMQEYAEILSAIPEIMNACIAKYKRRLMEERSGFMPIGGAAVIVPAHRPKTLSEAKAIADKML